MPYHMYQALPDGSVAVRDTEADPWRVLRTEDGGLDTDREPCMASDFAGNQNRFIVPFLPRRAA